MVVRVGLGSSSVGTMDVSSVKETKERKRGGERQKQEIKSRKQDMCLDW
jgi:hypothetical protein